LQLGNGGGTGSILGNVVDEGTLIFNRSNTYVFSGVISDIGNVVQNGAGTTVLAADNTYQGGTSVNAGSLIVGNGGSTGSLIGNVAVASGATFGVNRSDVYVVPNAISGAGGFVQAGSGTTIFNTAQSYTGMTTINAGTLQIGNGGVAGSIASTAIVDNATLAVNKSNSYGLAANISGTGGFNQIGIGTTSLTGSNTYSGITNVTAGILRAGVAGAFSQNSAFDVGASGTLNLSGFNQTIGSLTGSGVVLLAAATLTTGNDNTSTTYSGAIQGAGGLTKVGSGNFILSGTSLYTGATTVSAGTLSVNGSIASSVLTTVASGGTLGGNGTVGDTVVNAGGILAPGNSIGTVTVSGNLTFNSGSSYNVEVSPTAADRTNVTGTATLAGTVNASYASGSYTAKQYTILNATGGLIGSFNALVNSGLPRNIIASLSYDTNNAYLDLALVYRAAEGALNTNQQGVSNALANYFNTTGGIPTVFTMLTANELSQIAGEPGAAVQHTVLTGAGLFMGAVFDNIQAPQGAGVPGDAALGYAPRRSLPAGAAEAYAAITPRDRVSSFERRWSVWATGYGANARVSGDNGTGSHETTSRVYGMAAGASYRLAAGSLAGFALGGAGSSFGVADGIGNGKADTFNAAVYGRYAMGPRYIAAALAYSWYDASTDRTVAAGGTTEMLHATFRPQALTARLEAGWRFAIAAAGVTPFAGLQTVSLFMPSYGEAATSGSGTFALSYTSRRVTATRAELGVRLDKSVMMAGNALTLNGKAAWAHDWNNDPASSASVQQLVGTSFTVYGAKPSPDSALLSVGAEVGLARGWSVAATFDGEFSRTTTSYAGKGRLAYAW
ncbi:MAG: autotransporter domain-containing protein, partial [Proteobacteria bacterium]|nr:autotransporter domain-containing protein [Pseudomonadota bacterium]